MISVDDARAQIMAKVPVWLKARAAKAGVTTTEVRTLLEALGCVLAEDVVSGIDVPPADNSAVDGYAVRVMNATMNALPISQRIPAGVPATPLTQASAARIFTGAEVPSGADAVVMQEDCSADESSVRLHQGVRVAPGDNIRPRGQDVKKGELVLAAGEKLLPWHLGLLASIGVDRVTVFTPLRVVVLSTGDELQEPGEPAAPGKIFNSNRYQLLGLLKACGFAGIDGGVVADTAVASEAALQRHAHHADVIVTTGGVSVGEEDHVRAAVEKLGELSLWKMAIKPGKPFAFGRVGEAIFAGLPGNPSAVLVTFLVLLKPFLDACQGRQMQRNTAQQLPVDFDAKPGKRQEYLRVRVVEKDGRRVLVKHPNQSSGMLSSACWAEGLGVLPAGVSVSRGDDIAYWDFAELLS
ncbi:MAG: molybdopterin molybdotransferase MoeA [Alcanivoracaceae bacterium]|nr:molybdopterin molybdotransferase MoeA [Alcanivoracaceae bacterium]